jgi:hypothetical protein
MTLHRRLPFVLALTLSFTALACKDDAKKTDTSAPRAPEPIPSDYVVNGFFPAGSDQPPQVSVRTDGGTVAVPVDGAAPAPSDTPPATGGANAAVKVTEPGDEPRAVRKYDFKTGKTETVTVTLKTTMTQDIPGQPSGSQTQPGMVFALALTPQAKSDAGEFPVKVTFTRAEVLPGSDADPQQLKQMAQAFKALTGQGGTFRVTPSGKVAGFALANEKLARSELAGLAQQTLEGLFVVLPDDAIGKGAKWEELGTSNQDGINLTTKSSYVLKDVTPDGLAIAVSVKRSAPTQAMADPRAPKGTTISIDGTTTGQVKVRVDRMPGKGSIDAQTNVTVTQGGGAPGAPPRAMIQKVSVKQTIDN